MKIRISENIKNLRKAHSLTQEQQNNISDSPTFYKVGDFSTPCLVPTPDGEFTRDTEREINLHVLRPLTELRSVARGGVFSYMLFI